MLGRLGLTVICLDKEAGIYPLPRAAHLDHEAIRILQSLGLADEVMKTARTSPRYDFVNGRGEVLLRFENGARIGPGGWPNSNMIHQPSLERALREAIARQPEVKLLTQWEFISLRQDHAGVSIGAVGPNGSAEFRGTYLVGADGARSPVREASEIELEDLRFDEPWLVIDTLVQDPDRLPDHNLQLCDPARPTTCVLMGAGRHRWEFMLRPDERPEDMLKDDVIAELLKPWKVEGAASLERKAVYRFNARIAARWRNGRVLLVGDAAHQMPPFAGQGLCSGLRDASNLCWKIARAVGTGNDAILDSYQLEREPSVRALIAMSMMMGKTVCQTDESLAAERDQRMLAARASGERPAETRPPPPLKSALVLEGPGAGSYFPQAIAPGEPGRRLDDVLGPGAWLLVGSGSCPARGEAGLRTIRLDDLLLDGFRDEIAGWLEERRSEAVLVRPDRFVLGVGDPDRLLDAWSRLV
jgi:3-(3-hydroxy-phenyl)propionate hydroxylase